NFANKLWNAARFVLGARPDSIAADAAREAPAESHLGPTERWLRSRVAATVAAADRAIGDYAFGELTRILYEAIWNEYCDWAIELAKVRLSDEAGRPEEQAATWWTLVEALDAYLRLLHPVMPFVTEAIWDALPHRASDPELLVVARWPGVGERDQAAEREVGAILDLIRSIRNARAEARVEPTATLAVDVAVPQELGHAFEALRPAIARLARAHPLERRFTAEELDGLREPGALTVIAGPTEAVLRPPHRSDETVRVERERLERDLTEAERLLDSARARLANEQFVSKAPPAVVDGARAREAELADQVERLRDRLRGVAER
ncbi:MAG TPA: class I tRNA ligase family protein, partial [Candidatus Limnocylindrales bacterium]|nr:class I tRNA ligase family protein [Candidatus Limnocylindrales bacterium]